MNVVAYSTSSTVCESAKISMVDCLVVPDGGGAPAAPLASLLTYGANLRASKSFFVGFVHADVYFLSGLAKTLSAVVAAQESGGVPRDATVLLGRVAHVLPQAAIASPAWSAWAQHGEQGEAAAGQLWGAVQGAGGVGSLGSGTQHGFVLGSRVVVSSVLLPGSGDAVRASTPSELAVLLAAPGVGASLVDVSASVRALHVGLPDTESMTRLPAGASQGVDTGMLGSATAVSEGTGRITVRAALRGEGGAQEAGLHTAPTVGGMPVATSPVVRPAASAGPSSTHKASPLPAVQAPIDVPPPALQPSAVATPRLVYEASEDVDVLPACGGNHSWSQRAVVGQLIPRRQHCLPGETEETLLTAFTTLMMRGKADMGDAHTAQKVLIQRNVLRGLAALSPEVRTVVFTDSAIFREMAEGLGMVVVSGVRSSSFGLPFIKAMYAWVEARTSVPMHGFMNGDIMFGPRLIELLQTTLLDVERGAVKPRVLLTGRRFNVQMPLPLEETHGDMVPAGVGREDLMARVRSFRARGAMFQADAQDYFYITRGTWKWEEIPDFVPGRAAYDNWLVDHSYRDQVESVDVTRCVFAIHQSGSDGHKAGLNRGRAEPDWNFKQMTPYIGGFSHGRTDHCNFQLHCPHDGGIKLKRITGRQRGGERGPPWTGMKYDGHIDPLDKKKWVCENPPPLGQLSAPEHKCRYA